MMRWIILLVGLQLISGITAAQVPTTFILVRHAEKEQDGTKDPELSAEGKARAIRLATLLQNTAISAIYSTPFKRTQNTIAPLATSKGIEVNLYEGSKPEEIDRMLKQHPGGTVLVVGHSNTIPGVANYLTGQNAIKNFEDSEYGHLLIVTLLEKGKANLTWLTY